MVKRAREEQSYESRVVDQLRDVLGDKLVRPVTFLSDAVEITLSEYESIGVVELGRLLGVDGVVDGALLRECERPCVRIRLVTSKDDECYKRARQTKRKTLKLEHRAEALELAVPTSNEAIDHLMRQSREAFPGSGVAHDDKTMSVKCVGDVLVTDVLNFHQDNIADVVACSVHPRNVVRLVTYRATT